MKRAGLVEDLWRFIDAHSVAPIDVDELSDAFLTVIGHRPPVELVEFFRRSGVVVCPDAPGQPIEIYPRELLDGWRSLTFGVPPRTYPIFPLGSRHVGYLAVEAAPTGCRLLDLPPDLKRFKPNPGDLVTALARVLRRP